MRQKKVLKHGVIIIMMPLPKKLEYFGQFSFSGLPKCL
jgi:hypothetical protein